MFTQQRPAGLVIAMCLFAVIAVPTTTLAASLGGELSATARDFCYLAVAGQCSAHADFERNAPNSERGIVEPRLGADRKPVYALGDGATSTSTTGQVNFDQWYRDAAGVNSTSDIALPNSAEDDDFFRYSNSDFFPVDDQLFGNQGLAHNYHFTLELHTRFDLRGDETFTFSGDDDLWVFVNDRLAIDLGGVHPTETATIDFSDEAIRAELGLSVGETYALDLFFAERQTTNSSFTISTDLALREVPLPPALWLLGAAVGVLAACRRRRA